MKILEVDPDKLVVSSDLSRFSQTKAFEERLKSSIEEIGLVEPIKVAPLPRNRYLVVDGTMRLRAISAIRESDRTAFSSVPVYVVDYQSRYEIRYQSDIYQDLLPSQLAVLVEHLHKTEHVRKIDIARYIGVTPPTLRNYTGLWRLLQRGDLFARIVELMDLAIIPASNPYAWLRLNAYGLRHVIEESFSEGVRAESWIDKCVTEARRGEMIRFPIKFVESMTNSLPPECYREGEEVRSVKRDLGLRRAKGSKARVLQDATQALQHLKRVSQRSKDPVLRSAARSMQAYLQ